MSTAPSDQPPGLPGARGGARTSGARGASMMRHDRRQKHHAGMRPEQLYKMLKQRVQEVQGEIQELEQHNYELRIRLAALQLASRVLHEARAAARAAWGDGDEQPCCLEALLLELSDSEPSESADGSSGRAVCGDLPSLLDAYPHLAPGASLLGLEGGPPPESTLDEVVGSWAPMVQQVLALGVAEPGRSQPPELAAVGARMRHAFIGLVFWRFGLFMESSAKNLQTHAAACGTQDAPLAHWERVMRAVGLTRLQARVFVELTKIHDARLEAIAEERAALSSQLRAVVAAVAAKGLLAPVYSTEGLDEDQRDAVEALNANLRRHQAALTLYSIFSCVLLTPAQFATLMSVAFPWPLHSRKCLSVLVHDLKFRPETFADEAI